MKHRSVIITGAASGFGEGLARGFAAQGASVLCADMNGRGADEVARSIGGLYGTPAVGIATDVTDESSVETMVARAVDAYGSLDVMISCAGVLMAGGVEDFNKKDFDFVTSVNYTGFFLCAKYAARAMKRQRASGRKELYDIIQINSKSGLSGSKANFAYSGGKFGGIGLVQSFALELAEYGIKVNAICPGNLLDGPLWSDPEKGLFRQYMDAGKVKGARTVDDIRRYYESLVPLGRGCRIEDVVLAAIYLVEQEYETGQALPVTGGQIMLR
ncbi:MAG: SDR family NAD(P)-dependent oxidoreductase [Clostridiales Family XIII bacterium]|nr:SDR family NAD(P)-dependent oxidoreductase [Clostridiales Family XIII bacterium]